MRASGRDLVGVCAKEKKNRQTDRHAGEIELRLSADGTRLVSRQYGSHKLKQQHYLRAASNVIQNNKVQRGVDMNIIKITINSKT